MGNTTTEKKVLISILGIQRYEDYDNSIEVVAPGRYYEKNNKTYITYKERHEGETEDTTTTIKIDGQKVSVMRFGNINSNMTFELNKKHTTYYDTKQGALVVSVLAKKIHINLQDGEGELEIVYGLEMDHVSMGINSFHIKIHSIEQGGANLPLQHYNMDEHQISPQ
jgi:uncharacterized beta-barrel protein YwiB (DUF1934 family)